MASLDWYQKKYGKRDGRKRYNNYHKAYRLTRREHFRRYFKAYRAKRVIPKAGLQ